MEYRLTNNHTPAMPSNSGSGPALRPVPSRPRVRRVRLPGTVAADASPHKRNTDESNRPLPAPDDIHPPAATTARPVPAPAPR
ncbi:hypothetical protein SAMN05444921_12364 [Streptomyces wuyuanensis]|uniref:Uncharacterized protein n=1 Tax=Streptomyces wuyuanensis TaxID=1196353 RepID=A0A1H0A3P6_9ACTN|nr:hypothetical protein SAMN05444921_12364 [Streptomyces wuyuanensis]